MQKTTTPNLFVTQVPGELMRDDVLKRYEPEHGLLGHPLCQAVGDTVELNQAFPLLHLRRFISAGTSK